MARTVRDAILDSRAARARLKVRPKPYYRSIDTELHLGYRKNKSSGKWVMRRYVGGRQPYDVETIATADDRLDSDGVAILSFRQAQAKVRELFVQRKRADAGIPAHRGRYTVRDCLEEYLAWMESERKSAKDSRLRANALILPELGAIECGRLTKEQIRSWRDAIAKAPARLRTRKGEPQKFRDGADDAQAARSRRASANRTFSVLKAALNQAWREGKIATDDAWRPVTPFKHVDAPRVRYLTVDEAKHLINASDGDFRALVQAALTTGARYGELANQNVGDFDRDSRTLHVRTSKSGHARHIVLTDEGVRLFTALTAGRPHDAPILERSSGARWGVTHQAKPMAQACERARITPHASFHSLRRTYASLSIMNGMPLMVVAKYLGHVDTRMVERHYGHMAPSYVADAIRKAAPRFGIKVSRKVVPIAGRRGQSSPTR
jgi:integrase